MEEIKVICQILFALCGLPAAVSAIRSKKCEYDSAFLLMWFTAELGMIVWAINTKEHWFLLNYSINFISLVILLWYKVFPERGVYYVIKRIDTGARKLSRRSRRRTGDDFRF